MSSFDNIGVFDEDEWDEVIEGDFVYLSREYPPRTYLIKKLDRKETEYYRFQYSKSTDDKFLVGIAGSKEFVKLRRFVFDDSKIVPARTLVCF